MRALLTACALVGVFSAANAEGTQLRYSDRPQARLGNDFTEITVRRPPPGRYDAYGLNKQGELKSYSGSLDDDFLCGSVKTQMTNRIITQTIDGNEYIGHTCAPEGGNGEVQFYPDRPNQGIVLVPK